MGGNIITASGLIFMGATADDYLRAFDEESNKELWRGRLPAGGQATPITYLGDDGRQYVVIAAGGHGARAPATAWWPGRCPHAALPGNDRARQTCSPAQL